MNDGKLWDLPGQKSVQHCHYLAPLKFCETSACVLGVYLQQRKAKRREWILHYFGFLRETSLSSSQCQNEHGEKCQCFNEVAEAKRTYSGENVLSCSWHTELDSQTTSKRTSCGVFSSFFSLCPTSCLPRSVSRLTIKFTSWAKLESSCHSKQYFIRILFTSWAFQWFTFHLYL